MGHDIADYLAIVPSYGTMDDIDTLLSGLHERNIKLLIDLVVNHTSDKVKFQYVSCRSAMLTPD